MTESERQRILKAMRRIQPDIARSWEKIFRTYPPTRVRLLEERFKEEAHFMGIPVPDYHPPPKPKLPLRKGDDGYKEMWQEAWKLVESRRRTDPEWAMRWSVRLNQTPKDKLPELLLEIRKEVEGVADPEQTLG